MDAELVDVPEVVEVAEARRPGRPRSAEADEAILEAAVELFAEVGLESLTIEGVAARAGVGKATIYRRYPCKVDLVVAAARCFTQGPVLPPDTGSTRGDLRELVDGLIEILTTTPLGRVLPILVAARTRVAELDRAYADIVAEKRARSMIVVRRAIERGDLRPDVDPELVIDSYVSPIFYRFLITNAALDEEFAASLVDATLRAFGS
jgi:AcrR family transcriptional regulator